MQQDRTMNLKWKYPVFPPRAVERDVMFSLMNYKGSLYFVNDSNETLDVVSSESFGFILDSSLEGSPKFYYENVKPNESVKVEEYDDFYDLDYVLGFDIFIQSANLGQVKIVPPPKKGGVREQELLYKDMNTPSRVSFVKL